MFDLEVCEHEAAHAVLARHCGVKVTELRVDQPHPDAEGWCTTDPGGWFPAGAFSGRVVERVAHILAGEIWLTRFERKRFPRASGFGSDRAAVTAVLRASSDDSDLRFDLRRRAEKLAMRVLEERRDDVLAVAGRLTKYGRWDSRDGWARAASAPAVRRPEEVRSAPVRRDPAKEVLRTELRHLVDSGGLTYGEAMDRWISAGYRSNGVRGVA